MTGQQAPTHQQAPTARPAPRVLVVQHEEGAPLGRLQDLPGVEVHVARPDRGEDLPATADGWDGVLVLGGAMAAWEDDVAPWLPRTRALLVDAVRRGTPTLGVCLGAQLLALACGGEVRRGPAGPELGVVDVTSTPAGRQDAFVGTLGDVVPAPQGHHDSVIRLPDGAVLLATSAMYENQSFRVGGRAWGIQYHPEVTREAYSVWMESDAAELARIGRTPADVVAQFDAWDAELVAAAARHAAAFAGQVRAHVSDPGRTASSAELPRTRVRSTGAPGAHRR